MAKANRYYSAEDSEIGVTPSRLKRLGKAKQREYLLAWFHHYFEDPAQETPYNSQEGGYLYVFGGPYNAREELDGEFGSFISEEVIEEVVREIEADGVEWAPSHNHADHEQAREEWEAEQAERNPNEPEPDLQSIIAVLQRGEKPRYGDEEEKRQRQEILDRLEQLERMLPEKSHAGIGHNNPPPDEGNSSVDVVSDIREVSELIRGELVKTEPNALELAKATSYLASLSSWVGKKADLAVDSFTKGASGAVGTALGTYGVSKIFPEIGTALGHVVEVATQWLSHVTLPF